MGNKGTKNTLADLNLILFEQLERLNDTDIKGEELGEEMERAKGVANIAQTIINNNDLAIKAMKVANEYGNNLPRELQIGDGRDAT